MALEIVKICDWILSHIYFLSENVINIHYRLDPDLLDKYGETGRIRSMEDVNFHLSYLAAAMKVSSLSLFLKYVEWLVIFFKSIQFPVAHVARNFQIIRQVLRKELPFDKTIPLEFLDQGEAKLSQFIPIPDSYIKTGGSYTDLAGQYLNYILLKQRDNARQLILNRVESGTEIRELYFNIFEPVQKEIGILWQLGKITVADEHYATAVTQLIISELYNYIFQGKNRKKGKFAAACMQGELHEIGLRMITDLCEIDGWDTYYLGTNTPAQSIVKFIESSRIDILGLSVSLTPNLIHLEELINMVRNNPDLSHVKIIVGGFPFSIEPDLFKKVGADGSAQNLISAVETINSFKEDIKK